MAAAKRDPKSEAHRQVAVRISTLLTAMGMTQEQFADASGSLKRTDVSAAKNGQSLCNSGRWFAGIAKATGANRGLAQDYVEGKIDIDELMGTRVPDHADPDLDALDRVIRGPRPWWPSGTTADQIEFAATMAKGERFKVSDPSILSETYWFGRLQELAREVTGRAKSVHQREAVEDPADRDARELEEERARRKAAREARNKG